MCIPRVKRVHSLVDLALWARGRTLRGGQPPCCVAHLGAVLEIYETRGPGQGLRNGGPVGGWPCWVRRNLGGGCPVGGTGMQETDHA